MFILVGAWFYFAWAYGGHQALSYLALLMIGLALFCQPLRRLGRWLLAHKWPWLLVVMTWQCALLFSTDLMIRSDAAYVFKGAFELINAASISHYLTINPNNLLLFLYERFFYKAFGILGIWPMQWLNMFYVNVAGLLLYEATKRHISRGAADVLFVFYFLFLGTTPQFLAMYTDIMLLPVLALVFWLCLSLGRAQSFGFKSVLLSLVLGTTTALGYQIRPTILVLPIAFFLHFLWKQKSGLSLSSLALFAVTFSLATAQGQNWLAQQTEVKVLPNRGKTALAFIDLGLTDSGTNQQDFQEGLKRFVSPATKIDDQYDGRYSDEVVKKDIARRLKAYTPKTFWQHLVYKYQLTVQDGSLTWNYRDYRQELDHYRNPIAELVEDLGVVKWLRQHILYTDQPQYSTYKAYLQVVYLCLLVGVLLGILLMDNFNLNFTALTVFGGLLFLMIFEGGKTRYLIQFLPGILILAAYGYDKVAQYLDQKGLVWQGRRSNYVK